MDTVIQIDLDDMFTRIRDCENHLDSHMHRSERLIGLFEVLAENVSGSSVHKHILTIIDSLKTISNKMSDTTNEAIVYVKNQINSYVVTYEGAQKMFERALQTIESFNSGSDVMEDNPGWPW